MIPYIRGRYHSRNAESIISEVRDLVAGGVREIVLIGQDTGIWGTDFADEDVADGSPRNLAQLLQAVSNAVRPQNVWVRVLYLQPEGMTDELIETIRDTPEVLPYIDIPVQHCDARILKAMRRSGSRQELEDLFRDLRERIPGIVIRSTAMVGFPTETDDEFRDLIDFMDTVGFDYTSVFAYSQEEGSLAAKMEGQVDEEVKLERAQEAMDLGAVAHLSAIKGRVPFINFFDGRRPCGRARPGDRRRYRRDRGRRRADRPCLVPGARFRWSGASGRQRGVRGRYSDCRVYR